MSKCFVNFKIFGAIKPIKAWGKWVNNIDLSQNGGFKLQGDFAHLIEKVKGDLSRGFALKYPENKNNGALYWCIQFDGQSIEQATNYSLHVLNLGGVCNVDNGNYRNGALDLPTVPGMSSTPNYIQWTGHDVDTVAVFQGTDGNPSNHLQKSIDVIINMRDKGFITLDPSYYTSKNNRPLKVIPGQNQKAVGGGYIIPSTGLGFPVHDLGAPESSTTMAVINRPEFHKICDLPNNYVLGMFAGLDYHIVLSPHNEFVRLDRYLSVLDKEQENKILSDYPKLELLKAILKLQSGYVNEESRILKLLMPLYNQDGGDDNSPF